MGNSRASEPLKRNGFLSYGKLRQHKTEKKKSPLHLPLIGRGPQMTVTVRCNRLLPLYFGRCPQGTHCSRKRRWQVFNCPSVHASRIVGALLTTGGLGGGELPQPISGPGSCEQAVTHTARLPDAPPFLRVGDRLVCASTPTPTHCSGRPKVITGIDPGQSPHSFGCATKRFRLFLGFVSEYHSRMTH